MAMLGENLTLEQVREAMQSLKPYKHPDGMKVFREPPGAVSSPIVAELLKEMTVYNTELVHFFDLIREHAGPIDFEGMKLILECDKPRR